MRAREDGSAEEEGFDRETLLAEIERVAKKLGKAG